MLEAGIWGVLGALSLVLIYQHLRVHWPASYFGPAETLSQIVSRSAARYAIFRFGPPLLVFSVVGTLAEHPFVSVSAAALVYIALSSLLSVWSSLHDVPGSVRLTRQRVAVLAVIALGNVAAALAGYWLSQTYLRNYRPTAEDLVSNVMAGLVAAGLSIGFLVLSRAPDKWGMVAIDLPDQVVDNIRWAALDANVDELLAVSIAYVENAERPPWFRRVERLNPLWRGGSYGLLQVSGGRRGESDAESIRRGLDRLRGVYPVVGRHGLVPAWAIAQCAERFNPDPQFAGMVASVYRNLRVDSIAESAAVAPDGRPVLQVSTVSRFRDDVKVRGTMWGGAASIVLEPKDVNGVPLEGQAVQAAVLGDHGGRASWSALVRLGSTRLTVRMVDEVDDCFGEAAVGLQLDWIHIRREVGILSDM